MSKAEASSGRELTIGLGRQIVQDRALIETILLEPDGDQLKITLKGDLAGMLNAGQRQQEVARYWRPLGPNKAGCGGAQPSRSP